MWGKKKSCKHDFQFVGHTLVPEITKEGNEISRPRVILGCKKCGVFIHKPIYTLKQLSILESENEKD